MGNSFPGGCHARYGGNRSAAATQVAIDILKRGGTAVDAAIAANAALGLMEPVSCGIGGDLFAIVWDPQTRKLYGLNGSGRSPLGRNLPKLLASLQNAHTFPATARFPLLYLELSMHGSSCTPNSASLQSWMILRLRSPMRVKAIPFRSLLPIIGAQHGCFEKSLPTKSLTRSQCARDLSRERPHARRRRNLQEPGSRSHLRENRERRP